MSKRESFDREEKQLKEYGLALRSAQMPETAKRRWRDAIKNAKTPWFRPRLKGYYAAAAVPAAVILLCLVSVLASPTMALYAGSVPILGPFFKALGADRGLQMSQELGVSQQLELSETVNGIEFELVSVVADVSRTVFAFRITGPSDRVEPGEMIDVSVTDQWGRSIGGGSMWYKHEYVDDQVILTGTITKDGMITMTRHLNLVVNSISGVKGPWEFKIPVSYNRAAALSESYDLGVVSDEINGIQLEVVKLECNATETVVTYRFHGLRGWEDGLMFLPRLYTGDGTPTTPLRNLRASRSDLSDDHLVETVAYEPIPDGTTTLRVEHEAIGMVYLMPEIAERRGNMARAMPDTLKFEFAVTEDAGSRILEPNSPREIAVWGTTVEITEAQVNGNEVIFKVRGTDGLLVDINGFMLVDNTGRHYQLPHDSAGNFESETKFGHLGTEGLHFEYTLRYTVGGDAQGLTLSFPHVTKYVEGPWVVEFELDR